MNNGMKRESHELKPLNLKVNSKTYRKELKTPINWNQKLVIDNLCFFASNSRSNSSYSFENKTPNLLRTPVKVKYSIKTEFSKICHCLLRTKDFDKMMIIPKTSTPLRIADVFMNMHWNQRIHSEAPSNVTHTQFSRHVSGLFLDKINFVYILHL